MFGAFWLKSIFQNDLPDLDSLVIYQSYIALCEIRFRTVTWVRTVVSPINKTRFLPGRSGASTVSGDSAGDLENWTRTHDILFWLHLCVSLHCMCIGAPKTPCSPSAIPEWFTGGSLWEACHKADRLRALPRWEHKPQFLPGHPFWPFDLVHIGIHSDHSKLGQVAYPI